MAARLNLNKLPYFSWKGMTINQISSSIQKNLNTNSNVNNSGLQYIFMANPLKIYRREIASTNSYCNERTSIKIDELNRPNGSINNSNSIQQCGVETVIDNTLPNNTCENPGTCLSFLSPADNAKRRLRSSGNVKRKFDISKNNDTYYTSSNQYLVSRNRTFQQNQYNYIRQGNSAAKPGDSLSVANIYSPQGLTHCKKYHITSDVTFQYQWIDGTYNNVTVPSGYYDVDEINAVLQRVMANNYHYYIVGTGHNINTTYIFENNYLYNQTIAFLLNIGYNSLTNKIELQSISANTTKFPDNIYMINTNANWTTPIDGTIVPGFRILANEFRSAIGYEAGDYPSNIISITTDPDTSIVTLIQSAPTTNQLFSSSSAPGVQPTYVKLFYKPNNPQFGQQGAVSSSALTTRLKYDSITNATVKYRNAYGSSVANALAYGVPEYGYTNKTKIGFPQKKTPVFSKYSNTMKICETKHMS